MTLTGSDHLLRLSALAVSFVGWSAIVYFVRFFIEGGLGVAAFGLLPGALSFWLLVVGGWVFVQNLELFLGVLPARERP